jgi:hypothetical protein
VQTSTNRPQENHSLSYFNLLPTLSHVAIVKVDTTSGVSNTEPSQRQGKYGSFRFIAIVNEPKPDNIGYGKPKHDGSNQVDDAHARFHRMQLVVKTDSENGMVISKILDPIVTPRVPWEVIGTEGKSWNCLFAIDLGNAAHAFLVLGQPMSTVAFATAGCSAVRNSECEFIVSSLT